MQNIAQPLPVLEKMPARRPKAARTLGIIGGGQLAKMLAQSAAQFGCDIVVLERNDHSPAASLATETVIGDWDNPDSLLVLGSLVDVITLENEFVDGNSLAALDRFGYSVWPTPATIQVVQDKLFQKRALAAAGLPVPRFAPAPDKGAVSDSARQFGWPIVLKKRRNGYDGKGNATLRSSAEIDSAWEKLDGDSNPLYIEEFCNFAGECAMMVTRSRTGEMVNYPLVETIQHDHICHVVKAPASVPPDVSIRGTEIARRAVDAVGGVGTFGVEMFLLQGGRIQINELAPRVHNSGHYTIEACVCSQFENHIRAVLGWPLGSTAMRSPAAVMINLLGASNGPGIPYGLDQALAIAGVSPHIYGKSRTSPGRKMGHVTALGKTVHDAYAIARRAADFIHFGAPK